MIDCSAENYLKQHPEAWKCGKNTANTQKVRFFKPDFDFYTYVFLKENRDLFLMKFQVHTKSKIMLWLPATDVLMEEISPSNCHRKEFFCMC